MQLAAFHITVVEIVDRGEREMYPIAMTIINLGKEYYLSRKSNQWPPVLQSCRLPTEQRGLNSLVVLVVFGFNATLTAKVISWLSVTHMCFLAFSHQY